MGEKRAGEGERTEHVYNDKFNLKRILRFAIRNVDNGISIQLPKNYLSRGKLVSNNHAD